MKVNIEPKKVLLWSYVTVSALFIAYSALMSFRDGLLRNAYEAGRTDTVKTLIDNATNGKCEALNVYAGEKKVDLINVECLQKTGAPSAGQTTPPAPAPANAQ